MAQRGSDKVSPMQDDQLKHELEPILRGAPVDEREEFLQQETSGDGEPVPNPGDRPDDDGPVGLSPSQAEVEGRSELAQHLRPSAFPARPDELVAVAVAEGASPELVARLRSAPDDLYDNVSELWEAIGGAVEAERDHVEGA